MNTRILAKLLILVGGAWLAAAVGTSRRDDAKGDRSRDDVGVGRARQRARAERSQSNPQDAKRYGPGRGRHADRPRDLGAKGWRDILTRVYKQTNDDNLWVVSAGVAFFGLMSLFPAIAATVSIYGLVADVSTIESHLIAVGSVLPGDAREIVEGQIRAVTESSGTALGFGVLLTLGFAIYSASSAVKALMTGLTVAYDEIEERSVVRYNLVALALTVGAILFLLISLSTIIVLPIAFSFIGLGETVAAAIDILRWPMLALMVVTALAAFYRFAPCRSNAKWRWVSWGSVLATAAWIAGSAAFSWYVTNFASYNETYGTLGAVVILLMWFYLTAYIVLLGAELNAEMEHQTVRDTTDSPEDPIGRRGAYVADTVGERA